MTVDNEPTQILTSGYIADVASKMLSGDKSDFVNDMNHLLHEKLEVNLGSLSTIDSNLSKTNSILILYICLMAFLIGLTYFVIGLDDKKGAKGHSKSK